MSVRPNSYAFCGGAFGDEGKGRIVDEYVSTLSKKGKVVVYRDNGGANAGHTVTLPDGQKLALHQLPSGVFCEGAVIILGKEMVLHPADLITEIDQVKQMKAGQTDSLHIDEMAVLSLDTHRAFESALKAWQSGSKGSTGRGISPAYADVLLRHPVRMRDLKHFDNKKFEDHYRLYEALVSGLGETLSSMKVPSLATSELHPVGSMKEWISTLQQQAKKLSPHITDVSHMIKKDWADHSVSFVFEKAQAIGLDARWGVYPDITASNCAFDGITSSTEGAVPFSDIEVRAGVIKATYMSSVGARILPTMMQESHAHRIREDANEYGATTKRPRDIAYLDIPALQFYGKVGHLTHYVFTHMDISYPDTPIKVCTGYEIEGKKVEYRPDQEFLSTVTPIYEEFASWSSREIQSANTVEEMPKAAQDFLNAMQIALGIPVLLMTTGPQRNQSITT